MIKPKLAFFQMEIKRMFLHASEPNQARFRESPKTFYPVNVAMFIGKFILAVLHTVMLLVAKIYQAIVAAPAVRMNDAFRVNPSTDNTLQGGSGAIWNDFSVHATLPFKQAKDNSFTSGSPSSEASNPASAKITFINFNLPGNRRFSFAGKGNAFTYSLKQAVHSVAV